MDLAEFSTRVRNKNTQIVEKDIPEDIISSDIWEENYSKEDNFISVKIDISPNGLFTNSDTPIYNEYHIEFDMNASWRVQNSGGDGYITPSYDYASDIEIEVDITNIEDYDNDVQILLDDKETIEKVERWISYQLDGL